MFITLVITPSVSFYVVHFDLTGHLKKKNLKLAV